MKQGKEIQLTFTLSDKVIMEPVSYKNRYGITIAAHRYISKNMDVTQKHAAIIVGTPYGGVKEQGAGIYAQNMAELGFVAIAFDESYNGESGGEPRHISSPEIFSEDFSAGVDYLGTLPFVDRNRIGVIGICGSGAFAIKAAQADHRIKAIVTTSMVDMADVLRNAGNPNMTNDQRNQMFVQLAGQRWKDVDAGSAALNPSFPGQPVDAVPTGLDPMSAEFFEYYGMKRGHHPNAIGAFTKTSSMAMANFPLMNFIESVSPRPILFVVGENAFSRFFSEHAYQLAAEPKELYVVPGARHIDLYDRIDLIPFDKIEAYFTQYLK